MSAAEWYRAVKGIVENVLQPQLIGKYIYDMPEVELTQIKAITWTLAGNIQHAPHPGNPYIRPWRNLTEEDEWTDATQQQLYIRDQRGRVLLCLRYEYNTGCCGIMEMMLLGGHQRNLYDEFLSHMCKLMQGRLTSKNIIYWAVPRSQDIVIKALKQNDFREHGPAVRNPNTGRQLQAYMKLFPETE